MLDTAQNASNGNPWWAARIDELAEELGRLRCLTRNTPLEYRVERICARTWDLVNQFRLTAADRVEAGMPVEQALAETDRETRQMCRLLGLEERAP